MSSVTETVERARREWEKVWAEDKQPLERFEISFKGSWKACGEAMAAVCAFDITEVSWTHDMPVHSVVFACTFNTLKSVQAALKGTSVYDYKCSRR